MTLLSRVGSGAWFFLLLWMAILAVGRERLFQDPGTFWHVRVGERMLDTGRLVTADPYSLPFAGSPWVPHSWLAEVGMAALDRAGGFDALLGASAAILAATFTLPFVRLTRAGLHWSVAGAVTVLAVSAAASHFHARPHLLTLALFAVVFDRLLAVDVGRAGVARVGWLAVPFAAWANVHGGVVGGYGTVGLVAGGWVAFRLLNWPSPVRGRRDVLWLAAGLGLIGLTALATPYGTAMPPAWFDILRMTELPRIIQEHAPIDPTDRRAWAFLVLGGVYAAALIGLREMPRVTWLLPVVWFAFGCDRVRHMPLFAVSAALAVADVFPRTVWAARLAQRPDLYQPHASPPAPRSPWLGVGVCVVALAASAALVVGGFRVPLVGAGWAALPASVWPVGLVPALHETADERTGLRAFNEYEFGGFLIYYAPEYRPIVDDRCEVFGGRWLADFVAADADPAPAVRRWEAEYGPFDIALTRPASGFDGFFAARPGWEKVATAEAGNLYRRRP